MYMGSLLACLALGPQTLYRDGLELDAFSSARRVALGCSRGESGCLRDG